MRGILGFILFLIGALYSVANAQEKNCPINGNYSPGFDGCYHRTPGAVLSGCAPRYKDCGHSPSNAAAKAVPYILATPSQVTAALVCDIAAAAHKKGEAVDISKATITADLTFSLVTKNSAGVSLAIAAIPVFTGASAAPSLSLSGMTGQTLVATSSIIVDPAQLEICDHSSPNDWLTSEAVTRTLPRGVSVAQIAEAVQFIVTKQGSAGLKLNIIPISIGPQFSDETDKAQKICLLFDFNKAPGAKSQKPECPSAVTGGGSSSGSDSSSGGSK